MNDNEVLLEVKDLHTSFNVPAGEVRSVNGVSFTLKKGEVLGIVGESGSGKSVTAYSIMQILEKPGRVIGGSIKFKGQELLGIPNSQLQRIRGEKISIIFQDSMSSLNPVWSIGNQLREVVRIHSNSPIVKGKRDNIDNLKAKVKAAQKEVASLKKNNSPENQKALKAKEEELAGLQNDLKAAKKDLDAYAQERALEMLKLVGINDPEKRLKQYPFEHSGGMLQRIMIAMALICEPDLIIADEPTTALDVTIQAQILELLLSLQKKMGMGIIIITHDLGVVAQICDRVNVMYAGRIVESGTTDDIFYNPKHEYTKGLINSIPKLDKRTNRLDPIPGNPVDVFRLPSGCSFAPRCENCMKVCLKKFPNYLKVSDSHQTACFKFAQDLVDSGKMSEEELAEYLASCAEGNKAFTRISRLDVEKAYQFYKEKKDSSAEELKKEGLSKDEKDVIHFQLQGARQEYHRAKRDFKAALKDRKASGSERLSIDKNDVRKKIRHHKTQIKFMANEMDEEQFKNYLDTLVISTTPVNPEASKEKVAECKKEYWKCMKNRFFKKHANRAEKIDDLVALDNAKEAKRKAKSDLVWLDYVNKKLSSTKAKLSKIYFKVKERGTNND